MSASGKRALVCYTSSERPPLRGWTGWMTKQPFKNLSEGLSPRRGSFVAKLFGKWKVSVQFPDLQESFSINLEYGISGFSDSHLFCSTFFLWKRLLVSYAGGMVMENGVLNLPELWWFGYEKGCNTSPFLCISCPYLDWETWPQTGA